MRLLILALTLLLAALQPAFAERRLAFVAGIDRYPNLPREMQLQRAVKDAETVGDALQALGFQVTRVPRDATLQGLIAQFSAFTRAIEPGDTALFYFAGHGVALDNVNYLVPSDIPALAAGGESVVKRLALAEHELAADIQARGARVTVMVIDACRNNPFPKTGTRTLGLSRGLAVKEPARGVFSLYSAGAGQEALDRLPGSDPSPNSVFTRVFVEQVRKPGVNLLDLGETVREEVEALAKRADHDQVPAVYNQIVGARRIFLAGPAPTPAPPAPREAAPRPPPPRGEDEIAWSFLENGGSIAQIEALIRRFPQSKLRSVWEGRLAELQRQQTAALEAERVKRAADERAAEEAWRKAEAERRAAEEQRLAMQATPPAVTPPSGPAPLTAAQERALRPKDAFRECTNCPEMVVVPAGSFTMGSPAREKDRNDDEGPQRQVTIARPFAVGRFEVTFAEWDACVADGGCGGYRPNDLGWGRGRMPVINVSWNEAQAYAAWLSRRTGKPYRLLSEAEWEYVARGGTTTPFWMGATISTDQANYDGNYVYGSGKTGVHRQRTVAVGSFAPNPFGLHDVHGNVWEWVEDCWNGSYKGAPVDGRAWTNGDCTRRGRRGGSWSYVPRIVRSAHRDWYDTGDSSDGGGFRIARTL